MARAQQSGGGGGGDRSRHLATPKARHNPNDPEKGANVERDKEGQHMEEERQGIERPPDGARQGDARPEGRQNIRHKGRARMQANENGLKRAATKPGV